MVMFYVTRNGRAIKEGGYRLRLEGNDLLATYCALNVT